MPQSSEMQALATWLESGAPVNGPEDADKFRAAAQCVRATSTCIKFQAGAIGSNPVMIDRSEPHGWAVRCCGEVLHQSGQWEWEPMPSHRDEEFYASARFSTYEEAETAARKAMGVQV